MSIALGSMPAAAMLASIWPATPLVALKFASPVPMSTTIIRDPVLIAIGLYGPMKTFGSMKASARAAFTSSVLTLGMKASVTGTRANPSLSTVISIDPSL